MRYFLALFLLIGFETVALAQSSAAPKTTEMTNYVAQIDKALLENGINISVTVQTKCEKYDGLAGSPSACPALSFLGNYIDRPTTYAIVTRVLNSFTEARALGFKNVVFYGMNRQAGSRHTFDLTKPPPACSIDLCF
jgi:hypothetical protein